MTVSSYEPTAKEKEFVKYHERLRDELNRANWHFRICKHLRELGRTYRDEMNVAPAFFKLTMDAHLLATAMRLIKFFDKEKSALTIYGFLSFVKQSLDILSKEALEKRMHSKEGCEIAMRTRTEMTRQIVEEDIERVKQLPINNLKSLRNKALAHIEKAYVLKDINAFEQHPLLTNDIDEVISTLDEMLNRYSVAYEGVSWYKGLSLEYGMQYVVDAIRFKIGEERKQ